MPTPAGDVRADTEDTLNELRAALAERSIEFPELGLHFPSVMAGIEVISLGTIDGQTARQLTLALRCSAPQTADPANGTQAETASPPHTPPSAQP